MQNPASFAPGRVFLWVGSHMKYDFSVLLSKDSNHLTVDSAEEVATSIARLIEENETLRRLAALLTSQPDLARRVITALTDRERRILRLVSEGLSNKEIGRRLKITDGTIKVHLHHIFQKLAELYLNHDSEKTLGRAPASLKTKVRSRRSYHPRQY
jgi:DNA-binding CsgD family transcriptional regulator